jgi:osmoprotectant transport system substrate-binding protein
MIKKLTMSLFVAAAMAVGMGQAKAQIVVGGKNYTEQLLLAEMTTIYLADKGHDVVKRDGMGSTVLRRAQLNGQVDLYWEYVGTSLIVYNKVEDGAKLSSEKAYQKVKQLDAEQGIVWLEPSAANNTYALAMRDAHSDKLGIDTISEFVERVKTKSDLTLATDSEWAGRPDGLPGLQEHYDFRMPRDDIKRMQTGLVYTALKEGEVDVGLVFGTDGRIAAFNFDVLKDDKGFFPSYDMTPVVREDTLKEHPELREELNAMSAKLDSETMRSLNRRVDVEKETIEAVAQDFLQNTGLI